MSKFNQKSPAIRRGVKLVLSNARFEISTAEGTTNSGKSFQNVKVFAPVNLDNVQDGEIKYSSTLWEDKIKSVTKAPKNSRFDLEGYMKLGKPWKAQDGRTVISNEFVITSINPVKTSSSQAVEEVDDEDIDSIPF